jgi:hypothetical protein
VWLRKGTRWLVVAVMLVVDEGGDGVGWEKVL